MKTAIRESHLSLRGITVTYADGHTALAPTSLEVQHGGFLVLLGAGGMCEIGQIIGYGLAGLFLFAFGVWLAHGFYGQADKAEWLRESV